MMAFENLSGILVLQSSSSSTRHFIKQVYANRKLRAVQQSGPTLLDQFTNIWQVAEPSGGADNHAVTAVNASLNMPNHFMRRGEIDDDVNPVEFLLGQSGRAAIVRRAHHLNFVPPLVRDFRHQRARLAIA